MSAPAILGANEVIRIGREILKKAEVEIPDVGIPNFLDFSEMVRDVITDWDQAKRAKNQHWLYPFAEKLRYLRDNFEDTVKKDPLCLYIPAHKEALAFHKSTALVRYFRGGNRISKTESGRYDNYAVVTNQMNYRPAPPIPANVFIIGTNFSKYGHSVFFKKYILGESGNPLTPAFPEGGKWFYHYDPRKYIITVACPECAEADKAGSCKHQKGTVQLFSDGEGPTVLAGGQYAQGQFDEEVNAEFKGEAITRLSSVPRSSLMVTGTPIGGKGRWEHQDLTMRVLSGGTENTMEDGRVLVSLHTISQYDAGLVPHAKIAADEKFMSKAEAEARIYGRPSAYSEKGVFDAFVLSEMYDETEEVPRCDLIVEAAEETAEELTQEELLLRYDSMVLNFTTQENPQGALRVWEEPRPGTQYLIGGDVAEGMAASDGDYSCGQVLKVTRVKGDYHFEQVACYHGHINSRSYADELLKLAVWYNEAVLVVELTGPGHATVFRITQEFAYTNVYRDLTDPAQATFAADGLYGVSTNTRTKGIIVSTLQNLVKPKAGKRQIVLRDLMTVEEMGHFAQERTETGLSYRFRGEGGAKDDRVMALGIATYGAITYPDFYDIELEVQARKQKMKEKRDAETERFWGDVKKERKRAEREGM